MQLVQETKLYVFTLLVLANYSAVKRRESEVRAAGPIFLSSSPRLLLKLPGFLSLSLSGSEKQKAAVGANRQSWLVSCLSSLCSSFPPCLSGLVHGRAEAATACIVRQGCQVGSI